MDEQETSGFYKLNEDNSLSYAQNYVIGPYFSWGIFRNQHQTYTYPVHGWYWFDSQEEAISVLKPTMPIDSSIDRVQL